LEWMDRIAVPVTREDASLEALITKLVNGGGGNLLHTLQEIVGKPLLEKVLLAAGDNQSEAAKRLGVSRNTLRKMMAKYGMFS